MVDTIKISELPAVVTPDGANVVPVVQAGITKKQTNNQIVQAGGAVTTVTDTADIDLTLGGNTLSGVLTTTAVTPNTYNLATLTVDSKGRLTNAVTNILAEGKAIDIDTSIPNTYTFNVIGGGLQAVSVTSSPQALIDGSAYICNTGGTLLFTLPGTPALGDTFAIFPGSAPGWTLQITASQTVIVSGTSYTNTSISSGSANDCIIFKCVLGGASPKFIGYAFNNAIWENATISPVHYTKTSNSVVGNLEGIDNALTNVATIYRDVFVDVGRGVDGASGNGSQLYPYKTPAYAMSQITPTTTNRYNIIIQSGTYDGADGTFAIKPFTTVTCESSLTTRFTNSEITLDSSWLNTDSDISITNLNLISGTGINFNSTTFGTATINITLVDFRSAANINYSGRDPGKDTLFFFPTNVSGNIAIDSILFFCFAGYIAGTVTGAATVGDSQIIYNGSIVTNTTTVQSTTFTATLSLTTGVSVGLVTADGSATVLNLGAGMALFGGYSAINGATVNVITPASTVNGDFTPSNYTPVTPSVKGHLEGIDTKLGMISGGGLSWVTLTGSPGITTLTNNIGYICDTDAQAEFVLPVTSDSNYLSAVRGSTAVGFKVYTNTGQNLQLGTLNSGIGEDSYLESTDKSDEAYFGCNIASIDFRVDRTVGNLRIESVLSPSDLTSFDLLCWYKADDVNNGGAQPSNNDPIEIWYDTSGNANNLAQTVGSEQPLFKEIVYNGLPGLLFDGVNDYMNNGTAANTNSTYCMFMVCTPVALGSCHGFVSFYNSGQANDWDNVFSAALQECTPGTIGAIRNAATVDVNSITANMPFIYSSRYDGSNIFVYLTPVGFNAGSSTGAFIQDLLLVGARWASSSVTAFGNIYMHEILVFKGDMSGFQQRRIMTYLSNKWGIPNANG